MKRGLFLACVALLTLGVLAGKIYMYFLFRLIILYAMMALQLLCLHCYELLRAFAFYCYHHGSHFLCYFAFAPKQNVCLLFSY